MTEYTFQLNVKLGKGYDAHLVNVTGVGADDFKQNLTWVTENAAGIASTATALEAAYGVKELAPNVVETRVTNAAPGPYAQAAQQQQQAYQQAAAQPQQQGPSPSCAHGPMKLVPGGISKGSGKAYNAFYSCTAGRDSGCKSVNG